MKATLLRALVRFVRVFIAGAIGMAVLVPFDGSNLKQYLVTLAGAAIAGGLAGFDKFIRDTWLKETK